MIEDSEQIKVNDSRGFHYEVTLKHQSQHGFSTAYYKGSIIGQVDIGWKVSKPYTDDDREWEIYEERYAEWRDEIKLNIQPICKQYFDNTKF